MSKLTMYIIGVFLILLGILSIGYGWERHSAIKAKADMAVYKEAASELSGQLTTAHESFRFDMDAVSNSQKQHEQIQTRVTEVKEKVDAVSKKVKAGQISTVDADSAYLDSMWETYCQRQSDPACTSRTSSR